MEHASRGHSGGSQRVPRARAKVAVVIELFEKRS